MRHDVTKLRTVAARRGIQACLARLSAHGVAYTAPDAKTCRRHPELQLMLEVEGILPALLHIENVMVAKAGTDAEKPPVVVAAPKPAPPPVRTQFRRSPAASAAPNAG
jgi:hypothetical protein